MSDAERVANLLAYEFLRDGKYSAAHGPVDVRSLVQASATADVYTLLNRFVDIFGCGLGILSKMHIPYGDFVRPQCNSDY
jgi:hypothetical protein